MPIPNFRIFNTPEDTLRSWKRELEYIFNKKLNSDNILSTSLSNNSSSINVVDASSYFVNSNVEDVFQEIGSTTRNLASSNLIINDTGGYYTTNDLEGALQEIGSFINYSSTGSLILNSTIDIAFHVNGSTILNFSSDGGNVYGQFGISGKFGCNDATPQAAYTIDEELSTAIGGSSDLNRTNSLVNQIRTALINNGILTS